MHFTHVYFKFYDENRLKKIKAGIFRSLLQFRSECCKTANSRLAKSLRLAHLKMHNQNVTLIKRISVCVLLCSLLLLFPYINLIFWLGSKMSFTVFKKKNMSNKAQNQILI